MDDVDSILFRLRWFFEVKTDKELAKAMGIPYKTLTGWKTRNSVPRKKVMDSIAPGTVNFDWLFTGKGTWHCEDSDNLNIINGGNNQMGNSNTQNNYGSEPSRGKEWDEFVKLFDEYGSKALLKNFIATLKDEKEKFERL